jgi:RHH-type transcriptional regulator, proline utilization regulon repressor / proline dehydrogenase / delta 1-pyrroline-5-carboxylate dehydrogenase
MTEKTPLQRLDLRHRLEEVCEPYRLFPSIDDAGEFRLDLTQFGCSEALNRTLAGALAATLAEADFAAAIEGDSLVLGPGDTPTVADTLDDALYALRPLAPTRFLSRFPQGTHVPGSEALTLPRSDAYRARLVAGDFLPDDKKPPVLDMHHASGPYLASIDDEPLILFDAASQIATHAGGINPPEILEAMWTGDFDDVLAINPDTRRERSAHVEWLADRLREATDDTLPYVALCGSGAEANELALRVAAKQRTGRHKIVAFEGSFHGRTMAVLHATWNPAKRERFELKGYEARWCPWPTSNGVTLDDGPVELAGWDTAKGSASRGTPADADALEVTEWRALTAVEAALEDDQAVAIIAEPMQSEGGERHVSNRFMNRLRVLALAYQVPFIMDEVQTGFGLGGPFFWHRGFDFATPPDLVTVAKKAQVGGVLSRTPIDSQPEVHVASAIRGLCQADIIAAGDSDAVENDVVERLSRVAEAHPKTILVPRVEGYSFGFDLPDKDAVAHLIGQRLWRGWMLYGAGPNAVRFRLHPHVSPRALDGLFERLDRSVTAFEAGETTAWRQDTMPDPWGAWPPKETPDSADYRIEQLDRTSWRALQPAIAALQAQCYEPARRDDLDEFCEWLDDDAIYFAALTPTGDLAGITVAFPLEREPSLDGPAHDGTLGQHRTLYSAEVAVDAAHRGKGLGRALKDAQVAAAMSAVDADGQLRYDFVTGRNRVGETDTMMGINEVYGAYEVSRHYAQYGEPDGVCSYYRIPLTAPRLPLTAPEPEGDALNLDPSLVERLGDPSPLLSGLHRGSLNGAIANKLSLCNFVTPGVVRSTEMLRAAAPNGLAHLVTASSRAETCDKGLRAIKYHRGDAQTVIAIGPVRAGETTAAARALGRPADDPENWFGWPTTTDPCVDPDAALSELEALIIEGGAETILAAVIEPVFAATGRAVPEGFWAPLRALLDRHDVPLVALEETTGGGRSGHGLWRSDTLPIQVDALWWFTGGQLGLCFLSDALYVPTKLTLISTWDGDELSHGRWLWEQRVIRDLDIHAAGERLGAILARLGKVQGEGLFRAVETTDADGLIAALTTQGIEVGKTPSGAVRVAPYLDITAADLDRLEAVVNSL